MNKDDKWIIDLIKVNAGDIILVVGFLSILAVAVTLLFIKIKP